MNPLNNWLRRHRHPTSFWLHMVGIPATVAAIPLAVLGLYLTAAALFAAGYALQFIGHAIEGNAAGEEILVRRLLRLPPARRPAEAPSGPAGPGQRKKGATGP